MEAANKDKDKKLDGVLIAPISDTEEQDTIIHDEIGQDEADEEVCEAQLPLSRNNIQVETMIALCIISYNPATNTKYCSSHALCFFVLP